MHYAIEDMAKSPLGKKMQRSRADRPDEWTIDEFIDEAEEMFKELTSLRKNLTDSDDNSRLVAELEVIARMRGDGNWHDSIAWRCVVELRRLNNLVLLAT